MGLPFVSSSYLSVIKLLQLIFSARRKTRRIYSPLSLPIASAKNSRGVE